MTDEVARMILLAGFAIMAPVGIYFRVRSRTDEKLDRRQEGWPILLTLRPLALAFMAGLVAFLIHPTWMAWASFDLPNWVRWSGVAMGVGTACLLIWTFSSLGHNLTDTVVTRRNASLVTHGPYRWVRHPFYLAFGMAILANTLVTANGYLGATGTAAFLVMVARTSIEERKLIDRFGRSYLDYMQRTGRFLPRIRRGSLKSARPLHDGSTHTRMESEPGMREVKACHCCGLVHHLPPLSAGQLAACSRCATTIERFGQHSSSLQRTAAAALGAFFLYWPAVLLPILESERLGHHHEASLLGGTIELLRQGSWFVGTVILAFSIILPLVKILMLLELSLLGFFERKHKALTYRIMEHAGKWSMMDVMLLAFLVMLVKLGDIATFQIGPAVIAFIGCVGMSMLASFSFDPHSIWETNS
jgi:paraquat-inducible protein A